MGLLAGRGQAQAGCRLQAAGPGPGRELPWQGGPWGGPASALQSGRVHPGERVKLLGSCIRADMVLRASWTPAQSSGA